MNELNNIQTDKGFWKKIIFKKSKKILKTIMIYVKFIYNLKYIVSRTFKIFNWLYCLTKRLNISLREPRILLKD